MTSNPKKGDCPLFPEKGDSHLFRVALRAVALPVLLLLLAQPALAAPVQGLPALTVQPAAGGGQTWTLSVQVLLLMTALTLLPALLLTATAFTRIVVVLGLLRYALGTGQTPSNQILVGLALFLTFFVMAPVFEQSYSAGIEPYVEGRLELQPAWQKASEPLRGFMLRQTRDSDLLLYARLSGREGFDGPEAVPFPALAAAFLTSELKTAFQIGFLLFIPFIVIDLVVASVLMSLGMMMLSPMLVSLPFKIMLFVLVDGWALVLGSLAGSFAR
jgi:flagellar biosynthesis protein FliP